MKAVVVGAVESTRVTLNALAADPRWTVSAVVTLPASLSARHSDFVDLSSEARACGARLIAAPNSNAPEVIDAVRAAGADIAFVIGWSQICKPEFRGVFDGRVIGYHPAALPRLRGRAVIPWTILLDEKITGSTLFWIDDGVDSGPILAQRFLHVARDETATTLYARHMKALDEMLSEALGAIAEGRAPRMAQDERYATYAARRTDADGLIDWKASAAEVERLVRAVTRPYPGAFTLLGGERLTLWAAEQWPEASRHAASPGQVISVTEDAIAIACGEGAILVTDWTCANGEVRNHTILGGPRS
jgi:methionyl-tRNA formyltransferase